MLYNVACCNAGISKNEKYLLTLPDEDDDLSPEDEVISVTIPDDFRLQISSPAALDSSLVKRGVLLRLTMGWLGRLITRQSQERTSPLYD